MTTKNHLHHDFDCLCWDPKITTNHQTTKVGVFFSSLKFRFACAWLDRTFSLIFRQFSSALPKTHSARTQFAGIIIL